MHFIFITQSILFMSFLQSCHVSLINQLLLQLCFCNHSPKAFFRSAQGPFSFSLPLFISFQNHKLTFFSFYSFINSLPSLPSYLSAATFFRQSTSVVAAEKVQIITTWLLFSESAVRFFFQCWHCVLIYALSSYPLWHVQDNFPVIVKVRYKVSQLSGP